MADKSALEEEPKMAKKEVDDACDHAFKIIGDNEEIRDAVQEAFDAYDMALSNAEEVASLEENDEDSDHESRIEEAAHRVCDAVERPVGKQTFSVPRPEEFNRAVISLHDAIGRNI